eukprot:9447039-Prorocentrum_lima.AAC.1
MICRRSSTPGQHRNRTRMPVGLDEQGSTIVKTMDIHLRSSVVDGYPWSSSLLRRTRARAPGRSGGNVVG